MDVYVSGLLEKLIDVSDVDYLFTVKFVLYLSWKDEAAQDRIRNATQEFRQGIRSSCARPCFSDVPLSTESTGNAMETLCCDDMWLPTITMVSNQPTKQAPCHPRGVPPLLAPPPTC